MNLTCVLEATSGVTETAVLTATASLVAFHVGIFTLVGRERKSPYIINQSYLVFWICLTVALLAILAPIFPGTGRQGTLAISLFFLLVAFLLSFRAVFRIAVRSLYFVDTYSLKYFPPVRKYRHWRSLNAGPKSSHHTDPVPESLNQEIAATLASAVDGVFEARGEGAPQSVAISVKYQTQGNRILAELTRAFLKQGCRVQYLAVSRHPIEFVRYLEQHLATAGDALRSYVTQIVAIDAFSPHFAFADSIYSRRDRDLKDMGITCIRSTMTYAGLHSAASRAFDELKGDRDGAQRSAALVIYEDSYALTDLESREQYRIFLRHVLPSERMWDGMFTVFVEAASSKEDWELLQAYASSTLVFSSSVGDAASATASASVPQPSEPGHSRGSH